MTEARRQYDLVGSLVLLVIFSVFAFSRNAGYLFPGGDGLNLLTQIGAARPLFPFRIGSSVNLLEGFGDVTWVNYMFVPSYSFALMLFGEANVFTDKFQICVNVVLALEVFVATLVAALSFGFGRLISLMAAWMAPLLMLPYFGFSLLYPLLVFWPNVGTTIGENLLVLAAFTRLGRPPHGGALSLWRHTLLFAVACLMLAHMTIWSFPSAVLWLPVLGVLGLGLLASSATRAEVFGKLGWMAAAMLVWVAIFGLYIYGQLAYTATRFWSGEFENVITQWQFVSSWFRPLETAGRYVIAAAVIGLLLALADRHLRALAIAMFILVLAVFGGGGLMVNFDFWRGPSPVYMEMFIVPLYGMFAAYGLVRVGALLRDFLAARWPRTVPVARLRSWASIAILVIIPAGAIAGSFQTKSEPRVYGPAPPTKPPMISLLVKELALSPGSAFRGRVATFILQGRKDPAGWTDLIVSNAARVDRTGNDYYWSGLWPFRVPTLFEYNQLMSPAYYRTAIDLWGHPGDRQMRNVIVLRRVEPNTLALFGVKFVIADQPLPSPFVFATMEETGKGETLYLYEVPQPNLGGYSPTEIENVDSFGEAVKLISNSSFDARRTTVLFNNEDFVRGGRLVSASDVQVRVEVGGFRVEGSSSGTSLLVLPFEFSRCLKVTSDRADIPAPSVLRADGPLIGVLFHGRLAAHFEYVTSPFVQPLCRLRDAAEFGGLVRH